MNAGAVEAMIAQSRVVAREQARLLELILQVVDAAENARFGVDEVAFALTLTRTAADAQQDLARRLIHDLPHVFTALSDGDIDLPKARVFTDTLQTLDPPVAHHIAAQVLPVAPHKTTAQLRGMLHRRALAADPAHARKRRENGFRDRRVTVEPSPDGTARLTAFGLPPERAQAAFERITAIARARKLSGATATLDQLRTDTLLDLLDGTHLDTTPGPRRGVIELIVGLETLAGLNEDPGTLQGFGPVAADIARQCAAANLGAQWRFSILDPDGQLLLHATTRARPTTPTTPPPNPGPHQTRRQPSPPTPSPSTPSPSTPSPSTPSPSTPSPATPSPTTPGPTTPSPPAARPSTPGRKSGRLHAPSPSTPEYSKPGMSTPNPPSPSPPKPGSLTPSPSRPNPSTPSPSRPGTSTPNLPNPSSPERDSLTPSLSRPSSSAPSAGKLGISTPKSSKPRPPTPSPPTPSPPTPGSSKAGSSKAGSSKAGSSKTGPPKAGPPQAGPPKAGPPKASAQKAGPPVPCPPPQDPDARFPNAAMTAWIRARDRTCRAPGCRIPARACHLDHTTDYAHGGRTTHDDLGLLCGRHHVMKHEGGWRLFQIKPGHFIWVSPNGHVYHVRPEPP